MIGGRVQDLGLRAWGLGEGRFRCGVFLGVGSLRPPSPRIGDLAPRAYCLRFVARRAGPRLLGMRSSQITTGWVLFHQIPGSWWVLLLVSAPATMHLRRRGRSPKAQAKWRQVEGRLASQPNNRLWSLACVLVFCRSGGGVKWRACILQIGCRASIIESGGRI